MEQRGEQERRHDVETVHLGSKVAGEVQYSSKSSIRRFVITEKAHTRAFSWLEVPTSF